MHCPKCQRDNPAGSRFCNGCGANLQLACLACKHVNPIGSQFCNGCGNKLDEPAGVETRFASPQSYTPKHLAEKILTSKAALGCTVWDVTGRARSSACARCFASFWATFWPFGG